MVVLAKVGRSVSSAQDEDEVGNGVRDFFRGLELTVVRKTLAFHSMIRLLLKCEHDVFTTEY